MEWAAQGSAAHAAPVHAQQRFFLHLHLPSAFFAHLSVSAVAGGAHALFFSYAHFPRFAIFLHFFFDNAAQSRGTHDFLW